MTQAYGRMAPVTYDSALRAALDATVARMQHLDDADRQNRTRWRAYAEMATEKSQRAIGDDMVAGLRELGWSDAQIKKAGVSHDNIAVGIGRARG